MRLLRLGIMLTLLVLTGATVGGNQENRAFWLHHWVHPAAVEAGNAKCDPKSGDSPCGMKSCARMAKKQQWCSKKCHNSCCVCPIECNGHNPERPQNPEEE